MTKRVRIALIVDEHGNWNAVGWQLAEGQGDAELLEAAYGGVDDYGDTLREYFVTAEVELPVTSGGEIAGEVEPQGAGEGPGF